MLIGPVLPGSYLLQSERVWRSYITRALLISFPDTPNSRTQSPTSLEYPIPVKQSGHQVMAIGLPPTVSFTTSCRLSNGIE